MTNWPSLHEKVHADLVDSHQRQALGHLGLRQAEEGIALLASLGYRYELVLDAPPVEAFKTEPPPAEPADEEDGA